MPKTKRRIVLVGGGGHAKVVIDAIRNSRKFNIYGIVDPNLPKDTRLLGVQVIGADEVLTELFKKGIKNAFVSMASVGDCGIRKRVYNNLKNIGFCLPTIVHPKAIVARDVKFDEGVFVAAGTVINPGTSIGKNAILNTSSSIDHDCVIGDFVHIAPGATLSGGVRIGNETHVGSGARIIQYLSIGQRCTIGAGSVVIKSINQRGTYVGSPARNIKLKRLGHGCKNN